MGCSITYRNKVTKVFEEAGFSGKTLNTEVDNFIANKKKELLGSVKVDSNDSNLFTDVIAEIPLETVGSILGNVIGIDDSFSAEEGVVSEHTKAMMAQAEMLSEVLGADTKIATELKLYANDLQVNKGSYDLDKDIIEATASIVEQGESNAVEVFMHEVMHSLIEKVLRDPKNYQLLLDVRELRKDSLKHNDYTLFLNPNRAPTSVDIDRAKELFRYSHQTTESEFLAYVSTNERVMNSVSKLDMDSTNPIKNTTNIRTRTIVKEFNKAVKKYKFDGKNNQEVAADIYRSLLEAKNRKEAETPITDYIEDKVNKADDWVVGKTEKALGVDMTTVDGVVYESQGWASKFIEGVRDTKYVQQAKAIRPLYDSVLPAITNTASNFNKDFFELFNKTKEEVNKLSVDLKSNAKATMEVNLKLNDVPMEQREAARRVMLDTDISNMYNQEGILGMLKNPSVIDKEIEATIQVGTKKRLSKEVIEAAELLGVKLATGVHVSTDQFINAAEISMKFKSSDAGAIDRLASLYALKYIRKEDAELVVEAIEKHPEAIKHTVDLYRAEIFKLINEVYDGQTLMFEKGWKQDGYTNKKKVEVVSSKDLRKMQKLGYKRVSRGRNEDLSVALGYDMYDMVVDDFTPPRMEGLMSTINIHAEGLSAKKILEDQGLDEVEISTALKKMSKEKVKIIRGKDGLINLDLMPNRGIPIRSSDGSIIDIKYRLSYDDRVKYVGMDSDIAETIASTLGTISHRSTSIATNMKAVDYLLKFRDMYKEDHGKDFVFIRPSSEEELSKGKPYEFADAWDKIPHYTKAYIASKDKGAEGIYVHRSHLNNTFGYDKLSITKFERLKKSPIMHVVATRVEAILQEVTKYSKFVAIVLSPAVILGNHSSNALTTMVLANIGPKDYMKRYKNAWVEIESYLKDINELKRLEQEDVAKKDDSAEAKRLRRNHMQDLAIRVAASPMDILVKDGQHSTIIEDLDIGGVKIKGKSNIKSRDQIRGWISKGYNKLPKNGQKFFDEMYVTEDSATRSLITKLTTYSDLGSKLVVVTKALEDGKKGGSPKMQSVLNELNSVFVNYGHLDSKYVQYANDIGVMEYTKFFMRTMPATARLIAKMPVKMASLAGVGVGVNEVTGYSQSSIIESTFDPFTGLVNRSIIADHRDSVERVGDMMTPAYIGLFI